MIKEKISEIINERIHICEETDDNWDYGIEQCWKKIIEIINVDIDKSIEYFLHECTDEEFYWLSEVFEEIVEKTQSKDFVSAWRTRLATITPETYCQQNFKSELLKKHIDYNEYIKDVNKEIGYAEETIW